MVKDKTISQRVSKDDLLYLKEMGFKISDVWDYGMLTIRSFEKSQLDILDKKYHTLYIHVHTKLENFGKKCAIEIKELDKLLDWYKKQERSIDNPSEIDCNTVKLQLKKRSIESFTIAQVFDYWKNKESKNLPVDNKTLIGNRKESTVENEGVLVG